MLSLMSLLLAADALDIGKTIRDRRAAYNVAISTRNLPIIERLLTPDYVVLPGKTGTPLSKDGLLTLFSKAFGDASFVTYSRAPDRVLPSGSAKRVAEIGHWTGIWNKPDGRMVESGVYQAYWIPQGQGWKLINESFVTLECTGSRECRSGD